MTRNIGHFLGCLFAGLLLGAIGCQGPVQQIASLEGTVTLDGKPLEGIEVHFVPDGDKGTAGPRAVGTTDSKGKFTLTCGDLGSGALIGHHRVMFVDIWALPAVPDRREPKHAVTRKVLEKPRIPDAYSQVTTTPVRQEVKAGSQTVQLKLVANP